MVNIEEYTVSSLKSILLIICTFKNIIETYLGEDMTHWVFLFYLLNSRPQSI